MLRQKRHVRPATQPLELGCLLLVLQGFITCSEMVLVALALTQFIGQVEELQLQLAKIVPKTLQFVLRFVVLFYCWVSTNTCQYLYVLVLKSRMAELYVHNTYLCVITTYKYLKCL